MNFGKALELFKTRKENVRKVGWNGKGMFVVYQKWRSSEGSM